MGEKFNMANNKAIFVDLEKQVDTSLSLNSTRVRQETVQNPCVDTNDEVSTTKCKHFSIRGYVSEVRKRDPKLCYPFPLNETIIDLTEELPPMTIPESRWWRCSGCVPEAKNYDDRLPKDSSGAAKEEAQKGANVNASNNDLQLGLSSKVDNTAVGVRISEGFTSTDSEYNKDNKTPVVSNTLSDRKGKGKAHVTYDEIPPFSGYENGFLTLSSNQKSFQQTRDQIEINQCATDNEVIVRAGPNQNRTAVVDLDKENATGRTEVGSSNGYSRGDPQTSSQHRLSESPANGLLERVAGKFSGSCSRSQGLVNLPDLNECSDEPSDELHKEATVTGNYIILISDDDEDYLGTERRKTPKSRLMSELLSLKETQYTGKGKNKILSSSSSQEESVKRKRVGRPTISISDSDSDSDSSDVSNEKIPGFSGKKRYKSKESLVEMRNKKMKTDKGAASSPSPYKITKPKSSPEKGKLSAEELPQRVDRFAHFSEGNTGFRKKRGSGGAQGRNMSKECGATQKVGEAEKKSTEIVGKPSENVGHFLSNYPNIKENSQPSSSQVPKQKESQHSEETRGVTLTRTSAVGAPITGNQSEPEKRIDYPKPSSSEKITRTTEADKSRTPAQDITLQVSNSVPNQKEQTKEVRGRVHDIDINSIPTDDKPNDELGPGDDNLMEIAELMVKIRHERQGNAPVDNHVSSEPPRPLPGANAREIETKGSSGQPVQIFGSSPLLNLQKPPSTTMANGNSSQYSHYNGDNVGARGFPRENQNPVSSRFVYPNQDVEQTHPYSSARRLPPSFVQAVDSHQKFQAWSPQSRLTQPSSAWSSPGMPSRMPLGITNPRQMISPRSNTLNDGTFRHQNSRTVLNFENPESSSARPPTGVTVDNVHEAIPAMHLLSLMQNAATGQNTELSLGPQRLAAQSSSSRLPFSNNNNSRTFSMQENSRHPCYYPSTLPTATPFPSSSLNNDKGIIMGRNSGSNGFMGPTIPLTLGGQRNMGSSRIAPRAPPSRNPRPSRQVRRRMPPPLDKGKGIASTSNPAPVNHPLQVVKESLNLQNEKPISPSEPEEIACQLNQNPSEFNDLKLLAKYKNGPEDLRPRKRSRDN